MNLSLKHGLKAAAGVLAFGVGSASAQINQPITNFSNDVETAIDWGINWLDAQGHLSVVNNYCGRGTGLAALAVLEKRRADPAQNALSQGWQFANAADQARVTSAVQYIIANAFGNDNYRDGANAMALSLYLRTQGPDPTGAIEAALVTGVNRLLANQNASGFWGYTVPNVVNDSSVTQLSIGGLSAAKGLFQSGPYADPALTAQITAALASAAAAYEANGAPTPNSFSPTERAHGYWAPEYGGADRSLQQTASATWALVAGGRDVNDPAVQGTLEWIRNHYSYTQINVGDNAESWPNSLQYFMWSATKAMRLIELQNNALPGVITPAQIGTLLPSASPQFRQFQRDPSMLPRPASFANAANYVLPLAPINPGQAGLGYYTDPNESPRWYFDFAYTLLSQQDQNAGSPVTFGQFWRGTTKWNPCADQAWAILVLERAIGGVCSDIDEDGVCDEVDNCVNTPNADQTDANNNGIGDACEVCCDFPVGDPIASTDQACNQGGGIAVADVLCVDVVCCAGVQGQALPYLISSDECERAGGREIDEAICCDDELCCRLPNGTAITTSHADCVAQQGAPVPDEVCEATMCCALPDGTYSYVSAEECGDNGGGQALRAALALGNAPLWGDLCLEVCCHQADGTYATQVAGVCRDAGGMMAADPSFCEAPVCCVTADSASFVSAFECEQAGGNAMNAALCANVCCQGIAGQPVYATAFACNGAGGVSVEDSLCSAEVCCTLPDGTSATLSVSDCEQKGGLQVDQSCCEEQEICCALPDGTTENLVPSQCAARDGLETDPSCCVAVCCVLEDGTATSLSIETCAARGGRVDDTGAACEPIVIEEVCCALPDNTTATLPSDVCATRGGTPTAAEKCEPAAQVCCQRTDGTASLTDPAACVGEGLSVVANELCEAQVCCRVDGHLEWLAPRVCGDQMGVPVDSAACTDVICCEVADGQFDEVTAAECGARPVAHPRRCGVITEVDAGPVEQPADGGPVSGGGGGSDSPGCSQVSGASSTGSTRLFGLVALGALVAVRRRRRR